MYMPSYSTDYKTKHFPYSTSCFSGFSHCYFFKYFNLNKTAHIVYILKYTRALACRPWLLIAANIYSQIIIIAMVDYSAIRLA